MVVKSLWNSQYLISWRHHKEHYWYKPYQQKSWNTYRAYKNNFQNNQWHFSSIMEPEENIERKQRSSWKSFANIDWCLNRTLKGFCSRMLSLLEDVNILSTYFYLKFYLMTCKRQVISNRLSPKVWSTLGLRCRF